MAGGRRLPRLHLLLSAVVLLLVAGSLPGGLLPMRRQLAMRRARSAKAAAALDRGSGEAIGGSAEFLVDGAGRLLIPDCEGRNAAKATRALLRVRCAGSGRIATAGGEDAWVANVTAARAVDLAMAAAAAGERKGVGLVCGTEREAVAVAAKCLPIVARALRELVPRAYAAHVKEAWERAVKAGAMICCERAEEQKALAEVNVSSCGVKCDVETSTGIRSVRRLLWKSPGEV